VVQQPVEDYTVSGTTLTIDAAVASGDVIYATHTGGVLPITESATIDLQGVSDALVLDSDADTTISADTDDQIDFKAGGTDILSLTATTATFNDGVTITTADVNPQLTIISTEAGSDQAPLIDLYRNSSSPADDDTLGQLNYYGENSADEKILYTRVRSAIADVTDGDEASSYVITTYTAGAQYGRLNILEGETVFNENSADIDFRVESNGNANMLFVDAGNDCVGIGTSSPNPYKLEVSSDVNNTGIAHFEHTHATPEGIAITFSAAAPDGTSAQFLECTDNAATRLRIQSDGDVYNHDNSYGSLSDERVKEQIKDSGSQWDDLKNMKIRKFKFKSDVADKGDSDDLWRLGVVAQELEASSMNGLVNDEVKDGETITQYKTVKYSILYMKAIKALQEAMTKIETLETKVKALEDA